MPYVTAAGPCKKCGATNTLFRSRWNADNARHYTQSTCQTCEKRQTREHQKANPEYWRALNARSHLKKVGVLLHVYGRPAEEKRTRASAKTKRRNERVARVSFTDELTLFVLAEAYALRRSRKKKTSMRWSVDHTIPICGVSVSGLHIWSNLRVIPLIENCKKGNRYAPLHD